MNIKKGMKCRYDVYGELKDGYVMSVHDDGSFIVTRDNGCKIPQYDDETCDFTESAIGKFVFFEEDDV